MGSVSYELVTFDRRVPTPTRSGCNVRSERCLSHHARQDALLIAQSREPFHNRDVDDLVHSPLPLLRPSCMVFDTARQVFTRRGEGRRSDGANRRFGSNWRALGTPTLTR